MNHCGCNPPCGEPIEVQGWTIIPCKLVDPNRFPSGIILPDMVSVHTATAKVRAAEPLTKEEFDRIILEVARDVKEHVRANVGESSEPAES